MKYGEIIALGRHRLMCGDATSREDVYALIGSERVDLVLTDPPYGINVVGKFGTIGGGGQTKFKTQRGKGYNVPAREYPEVIGDTGAEMAQENYCILRTISKRQIIWGGQNFTRFLPPSCAWIFWDKLRGPGLSFSDGELAWTNIGVKIKRYSHKWDGLSRAGNKRLNEKVHPTQKPVELHMKILEDFSEAEDVILDCFGGSGTTLIAAELTGRTCLIMEISPEYCDVIRERFERVRREYPLMVGG